MELVEPVFIENDPEQIVQEMVAYYEQLTGKTLYPAQPERLIIQMFAYREMLLREAIQYAGLQNLVDFANAPALDFLGRNQGVNRLPPSPALCTLEFTLVPGHPATTIPAGVRVQTRDGRAAFATRFPRTVPVGFNTVTVEAVSDLEGTAANGYIAGEVSQILDPVPFVSAATNLAPTAGGADQESDAALRERIRESVGQYSNAGSKGAYRFFAKTANANIVDVAVLNPAPGDVALYPLMADGSETPPEVLNAVLAACNDERIRPLTDTVFAFSPTRINYSLGGCTVILYDWADQEDTLARVQESLRQFTDGKRQRLGQDVPVEQVVAAGMQDGVYRFFPGAFAGLVVAPNAFAFCTDIAITVQEVTNG